MPSHQLLYTCRCTYTLPNAALLKTKCIWSRHYMCTLVHILCQYIYNAMYIAKSLDGFVLYCEDNLLSVHFLVSVYRITKLVHLQQTYNWFLEHNYIIMHGVNAYTETMYCIIPHSFGRNSAWCYSQEYLEIFVCLCVVL